MSPKAVHSFFGEFYKRFGDARSLGPMQIACADKETAKVVREYRFDVDYIQQKDIAAELIEKEVLNNEQVLFVRESSEGDEVSQILGKEAIAIVDTFVASENESSNGVSASDIDQIREDGAEVILFANEEAVDVFLAQAALLKNAFERKPLSIACGESVANLLKNRQIPVDKVAGSADLAACLAALA